MYLWWRGQIAWRRGWGWSRSVSHWPREVRMQRRGSKVGWEELKLAEDCVL